MSSETSQNNLTIIVLGGTGFIGSAIAKESQRIGHETIIVGRSNYDDIKNASCDVLINANGNSKKYLARNDPEEDFRLSVESVQASLSDFEYKKYVYLSTIDVYNNLSDTNQNSETADINDALLSNYGRNKHQAEKLVIDNPTPSIIIRMAGFTGNGLKKNSVYDMLQNTPLFVHPDSRYQYLDTRDLAKILLKLISTNIENEIFNIAGDETIRISEVANMIEGYNINDDAKLNDVEEYEINIQKIKELFTIPKTRDTVKSFINDVQTRKVTIQ